MGLSEFKKWKFEKKLKESELYASLVKEIESLKAEVAALKAREEAIPTPKKFTDSQMKTMKSEQDKKAKPEDFINLFTGNIQEFNPNA